MGALLAELSEYGFATNEDWPSGYDGKGGLESNGFLRTAVCTICTVVSNLTRPDDHIPGGILCRNTEQENQENPHNVMIDWKQVNRYAAKGSPEPPRRVEKTEEEWKEQLSPEAFRITRRHGTERPFSGEYCEAHAPGRYACVCCGTELFDSGGKFESRSGWPSFAEPVEENVIRYIEDASHGMYRVEVRCNVCDAHLGHVFPDGPEPTGLRYCINSAALRLVDFG